MESVNTPHINSNTTSVNPTENLSIKGDIQQGVTDTPKAKETLKAWNARINTGSKTYALEYSITSNLGMNSQNNARENLSQSFRNSLAYNGVSMVGNNSLLDHYISENPQWKKLVSDNNLTFSKDNKDILADLAKIYSCTHNSKSTLKIVKEVEKDETRFSSAEYALRTLYKQQLETILQCSIDTIINYSKNLGIINLLNKAFEPVNSPQEGDLVFYRKARLSENMQHVAIYKKTLHNGHMLFESMWNTRSLTCIVHHDLFAVPKEFDDVAEFYRPKTTPDPLEIISMSPHNSSINLSCITESDSLKFDEKDKLLLACPEDNYTKRRMIDKTNDSDTENLKKLNISLHQKENLRIKCHRYAFLIISGEFDTPSIRNGQWLNCKDLKPVLEPTLTPQKGDLVVYFFQNLFPEIEHWGVYIEGEMVESKWGDDPVYRHKLFDVPTEYGDKVFILKLRKGKSLDDLWEALKPKNK